MAGKWGGARPGSGRKPSTLSALQVTAMLKKAKEWAKKTGKELDDILLGIIYDEETNVKDKLAGIKLWKEYTIAKLQEGGETDQSTGPAMYLPEQDKGPEPELKIVKK